MNLCINHDFCTARAISGDYPRLGAAARASRPLSRHSRRAVPGSRSCAGAAVRGSAPAASFAGQGHHAADYGVEPEASGNLCRRDSDHRERRDRKPWRNLNGWILPVVSRFAFVNWRIALKTACAIVRRRLKPVPGLHCIRDYRRTESRK